MPASAPAIATLWQGEPYPRSAAVLTFAVPGTPIAQGSKSFKGVNRAGRAILVESAAGLKPWRKTVIDAIKAEMHSGEQPSYGWPLIGPLGIDLTFTVPKPKSAPKTRRTWPIVRPDIDKLARAILDAGTYAGLWGDDSQVVALRTYKVYPSETPRALRIPGVYGTVHAIGPVPVVAKNEGLF